MRPFTTPQLARYIEYGYMQADKQFTAILHVLLADLPEERRMAVVKALLTELEIVAEKLVILGLDCGQLSPATLKNKEAKKGKRTLILKEEGGI